MNSKQSQEQRLLEAALALETAAERQAFLASLNDAALRERLERLLAASTKADSFFGKSPLENVRAENPGLAPTVRSEVTSEAVSAQTIGRYKLLEKIGEGGFGEVWMAEQREPVKRRVALKIIKLGMDSRQVVARFEAERQALAMMDHPNIAKILDAGTTEGRARHSVRAEPGESESGAQGTDAPYLSAGRPYFVMELVRGVRITDYCDQNQLPTRERLDLFIKVCQAIQHAHQKGVIHRDIKPSNILVTLHDGVPVPKVIDFGIAKATQQELTDKTVFTQFQQFIGTPAYVSPEQAEMSGLDIDTRADIYSLGVLLYELLTGKTPFDGKELLMSGLDEMRRTIREKEPARPSTRISTMADVERTSVAKHRQSDAAKLVNLFRGDLDWIVMKCLEKDRQRRYGTANGLAADLKRHLGNEPVTARPPSTAYRFQKAFRRNKLVFTAVTAVVVALVAGITVSTWQTFAARKAQRETEAARLDEQIQRKQAVANAQQAAESAQQATANAKESRRNLYAAEMSLATTALADGNLGSARQYLSHWRTNRTEDLREFTWRYLWQRSQGDEHVKVKVGENSVERDMLLSPDERVAAVFEAGNTLSFWDLASLKLISRQTNVMGFGGWSEDGTRYLVGHINGDIGFMNPKNGAFQIWLNRPHLRLGLIAGRLLLTRETTAQPWQWFDMDGETFVPSRISLADIKASIGKDWLLAAISRDLRHSVFGKADGKSILIWDNVEKKAVKRFPLRSSEITSAEWSRDGHLLAVGGAGLNVPIEIWNLETDDEPVRLSGHTGTIRSMSFSHDGAWLASASSDHTVRVWNLRAGKVSRIFHGHESAVNTVSFFNHDKQLLSAGEDGTLRMWSWDQTQTSDRLEGLQTEKWRTSKSVIFSPDGHWLAGRMNNGVCVWDTASLALASRVVDGETALQFGPDSRSLYVVQAGRVSKWDLSGASPRELERFSHEALNDSKTRVAISLDGRYVALLRNPKVLLEVFEFPNGKQLFQREGGVVNPSSGWNVSGDLAFAPDGRSVFVSDMAGANCWLSQLDLSGHQIAKHKVESPLIVGLAFSPSGNMAAVSAGGRNRLWLFDLRSHSPLPLLHGHRQQVWTSTFSADGRTLASASTDGTIRLWSLTTFQPLAILPFAEPLDEPHADSRVSETRFSPDGNTLAALSYSGTLRLFRAPTLAEIDAAEAKEKAESKQP